jgi:serine/threonine protein phosphatase PrpC
MTLVLLQSLSLAGDPAKPNEDAFASADHAALVLDGATPLGEPLMPGPSDAAWLAQFGSRRLMAHLKGGDSPRDALLHALTDAWNSFEALSRRPVRERWETPCAALMLATQAQGQIEFFWFGDCSALLLQDGACEIIGDAFDRRGQEADGARRAAREKNLSPSPDFNRAALLDGMRASRNRINRGAEWLFSPDPRAAAHVMRRSVKATPGGLLLLASDGFLALATDYGAYDAKGLMTAARDKGLAALGAELRAIENDDAMGEKFARYKKSDDATALLLEVA